jgi:MFS family permease
MNISEKRPMVQPSKGGERSGKIWTGAFINIFVVNVVLGMGQYMMNTLIPKYAFKLGGDAAIVGMVAGVFAVTALGIRPLAGPAIDYFKKNRLLSATIAVVTLSYVCYGFAVTIPTLVAARLFHGIGMGVLAPLSLALVSNILPSGKMASGLGIFSLGSAVAMAVGPAVGLALADSIGYNETFFICTGLMFVCFLLSLKLKSDVPVRAARFTISLRRIIAPEALLPTTVLFLVIIAYSSITSFIAIYGGFCSISNIGLFFTANALCMIAVRPISGRIADKYGLDKTVLPGFFILIVALVLVSFSRTLPMFVLSGAVTAVGFGVTEPIIQTLNMQLVPKERRGAASNTNFMGIDIGLLIGPTLAGFVINAVQNTTGNVLLGYSVMYRVMAAPVIAAIILFGLNRKKLLERIRQQHAASETALPDKAAQIEET